MFNFVAAWGSGQRLRKDWEVHKLFGKLQHISETLENHAHV